MYNYYTECYHVTAIEVYKYIDDIWLRINNIKKIYIYVYKIGTYRRKMFLYFIINILWYAHGDVARKRR